MGAVNTSYTFTATDTITSAKMNNIIDDTIMTSSAISGTTLQVTTAGRLAINSQGVTSNELADNAVITAKILSGSVTPEKLSSGKVTWGSNYTDIGYGISGTYYVSLTPSRLNDGHTALNFGVQTGVNSNASIFRYGGENSTFEIIQTGTGALVLRSPGNAIEFIGPNGISFLNGATNANFPVPAGTAPIYGARAWVNFDGTTSPPTIRSSGNVASVVKTAAGNYLVTLTTAIANSNYAVIATSGSNLNPTTTSAADNAFVYEDGGARTSNSFRIRIKQDDGGATEDRKFVSVVVFG